jgi:outer membrane murein-binding lipoprotein Lpp
MKYVNPLVVVVVLLGSLSLWGCTQQKTGAISAKIQDLELRYSKLEEDHRALQGTYEQIRKRLTQSEAQRAALEKQKTELGNQLQAAENERDTVRKQLTQRTTERDTAHTNLLQFSKELQALAGRIESALNTTPNPNLTIVPASRRAD